MGAFKDACEISEASEVEGESELRHMAQGSFNDVLSQGQYSMSLTSLDALLGGHGWLLKYRDKLPMTMILLRKMELIK